MSLTIDKCIEAWTNCLGQLRIKADIVFFGDSLTYYGDFASVFPDKAVCNLGLRGDNLQGMIKRTEQVKLLRPSSVFLMAGINDVAHLSAEEFEEQYKQLISALSGIPLVLQSILPVNSQAFNISCTNAQIRDRNRIIAAIAKERDLPYLDLYSQYEEEGQLPPLMTKDGIHLTEAAYLKWYSSLKEFVE